MNLKVFILGGFDQVYSSIVYAFRRLSSLISMEALTCESLTYSANFCKNGLLHFDCSKALTSKGLRGGRYGRRG